VVVEWLASNGDVFKKVWCEKLGMADKARVPQLERENIFVKQNRLMPNVPNYSTYCVSVKSLRKAGLTLRASAPKGWVGIGDDFLERPHSHFYSDLSGLLHFGATKRSQDSRRGFVIILNFGRGKAGSEEKSRVAIMEDIPNFSDLAPHLTSLSKDERLDALCSMLKSSGREERRLGHDKNGEIWAILDAQLTHPTTERIYWQHPSEKWQISVIIKRGIVEGQRKKIVHIDYHTPEKGDTLRGQVPPK
jgi:hypothetical protein